MDSAALQARAPYATVGPWTVKSVPLAGNVEPDAAEKTKNAWTPPATPSAPPAFAADPWPNVARPVGYAETKRASCPLAHAMRISNVLRATVVTKKWDNASLEAHGSVNIALPLVIFSLPNNGGGSAVT